MYKKIKVEGVEAGDAKVVIQTAEGKYDIWKTEYDKVNKRPGTVESKPYKQFQNMRVAIGDELNVDVYEKEKSFTGREGKEVTYTARSINEFLTALPETNSNGTTKPGTPVDNSMPF